MDAVQTEVVGIAKNKWKLSESKDGTKNHSAEAAFDANPKTFGSHKSEYSSKSEPGSWCFVYFNRYGVHSTNRIWWWNDG